MSKEINRKKALAIIIIIAIVFVVGFYLYINQKIGEPVSETPEDTFQKVIDSLTAPDVPVDPISKEEQESLSAPSSAEVSQEILDSLTTPK